MSRREQNKIFNRNAILDAAKIEFAAHGYYGANLTQIIDRSGLATGTFYKYFDGKEPLYNAVSLQLAEQVVEILDSSWRSTEEPESYIRLTLKVFASYIITDFAAMEFVMRNNNLILESLDKKGPWTNVARLIREHLDFAIDRELAPPQDTQMLIQALLGATSSLMTYIASDGVSLEDKTRAFEFLGRFITKAVLVK